MNYQNLLNTSQWKTKRSKIIIRDGYRCRNCNRTSGLQVHHKQYHMNENGNFVMPWDYNDKFLITLCSECHRSGHTRYTVPIFQIRKSKNKTNSTKSKKTWFTSSQIQPSFKR